MTRTETSVRLLQAVAAIAALAVLLWSLGLPSLRFAEAANLTEISDTLSDSASSTVSNHTLVFTTPTGVAAGESIVVDFGANFNPSALDESDFDLASSSDYTLAAAASGETWGVSTDATSVTFTSADAVLSANATVTIKMGTNATFGVTGDTQIVNPSATGSYAISVTAGSADTGETRVVVMDTVLVTASVETSFTFTVAGLGGGTTVNGTTTTGTTTATAIPFGVLQAGISTTSAQQLSVVTNAAQGFTVTAQVDQTLTSATGADINAFSNGSDTNAPVSWIPPTSTLGQDATYGHWGMTSDDTSTFGRAGEFTSDTWIAVSTSSRIVMGHDGVADGTGDGTANIGFQIQVGSLQEAGTDYQAILTYIATPTF